MEKPSIALVVEVSIQYDQFTPSTLVHDTPYHDWGAKVTVRWMQASISPNAVLSGLTTIHHSIGYLMGSRNRNYFILQSNSTPETKYTDQIQSNAILVEVIP